MLSLNAQSFFKEREPLRRVFLERHAGSGYSEKLIAQDWASRRYFRIYSDDKIFVLMEAVPDSGDFTPGHKVSDYIRINRMLELCGIRVPHIYEADEAEGYVLLEDFGDVSLSSALNNGGDAMDLYGRATDTLIKIQKNVAPMLLGLDWYMHARYDESHIHKGRQRLVGWYVPATRKARNSDGLLESYLAAWDAVEQDIVDYEEISFIHGDYQAENLMVLPNGDIGLLDFQGAKWGPATYDLANILEDIRRDVPADVRQAMLARVAANYEDQALFHRSYRIRATQFHCRIIGQVLRLAIVGKRDRMMAFMPRVQNYLREALKDPILTPLAVWMKAEGVDLMATDFNLDEIRPFIRDDAF